MVIALLAAPLLVLWLICLVDVWRRPDLERRGRVIRAVGIVVAPYLGVFLYLLLRPDTPLGVGATTPQESGLVDDIEDLIRQHREGRLTDADLGDAVRVLVHERTRS